MTSASTNQPSKGWSGAIRQRDFSLIIDWFWRYFTWVGVAGILAASLGYGPTHDSGFQVVTFLRMLGTLTLFAAAATTCGWMLGLLFGIPRSLSRSNSQGGNGTQENRDIGSGVTTKANTNLEDVSDWLTKTIVGVGLTGLVAMPGKLWHYAGQLSLVTTGNLNDARLLFLSLFLFCTTGGFWIGYVGTRTILTKLFEWIDRSMIDEKVNQVLESDILSMLKGIGDGAGLGAVTDADRTLLQISLERIASPKELAAWGIAHARNGDLETAVTALKQALRSEPGTESYTVALAAVYSALGRHDEAARLSNTLGEQGPGRLLALQSALYEAKPSGFEKAIRIGEDLARKKEVVEPRHRSMFNVWMACAYGQQYAYLTQQVDDTPRTWAIMEPLGQGNQAVTDARTKALEYVKAALESDSGSLRPLLRSLWLPGNDTVDDDLAGFAKDDPDMVNYLGS
jgi:tetratricopeptide (TPR) repeat protein